MASKANTNKTDILSPVNQPSNSDEGKFEQKHQCNEQSENQKPMTLSRKKRVTKPFFELVRVQQQVTPKTERRSQNSQIKRKPPGKNIYQINSSELTARLYFYSMAHRR
jgi:hypothetical protein